ncbi:uncharacterized protein BP5553_00478 [Venustampulla echinocandica]|uniref:Cytochrome P450 n=1 Tax=Venustampulla echinocandica TaxID=2656787 RepID=A0A370TY93_9HELO|nr:uncharacterized protein BP5553_00478 [Venustampulla echinocandica]RDL40499.1 hypothetical protein BP5553_00478 [Venustampulla echinocandica]
MAWLTYLSFVVVAGLVLQNFISRRASRRQRELPHIPLVKFDENDTLERYISSTRELMHKGYLQYSKKGQAFKIRNPVDERCPQVIISKKYLDEVKNAPEDKFSFPLYSIQAFLLEYSGSVLPSASATHVTRIDLNKNLDWTSLKPWDTFLPVISRVTGRVLVGSELCKDPEWIQLTITNTTGIVKSAMAIRETYSSQWQWLAPWTAPWRNDLINARQKATQLIEPTCRKRISGVSGEENNNVVKWLIDHSEGKPITPAEIADSILFLYMAGIHSTSASLISIVYDLIAYSEYIPGIIEEIKQTLAESPEWTKLSLAKLRKLDSFLRENQRLHSVGMVTVQRSTVVPYTFSDGLYLPANTMLAFPTYEVTHDPDIYPNPDEFDGLRFYRMREQGDAAKFHYATVSNESTNFGAGFHACPGRFFVGYELKIILAELLLNYDLKFAVGNERPPDLLHDFSIQPNPEAELLIRRKEEV